MLDELFDLFDRNDNRRQRQGGIRGFVSRLTGDNDKHDDYRERPRTEAEQTRRRDDDEYDDDDRYRRDRTRRSDDRFDFD